MTSSETEISNRSSEFKGIALFTPGGDLVYCRDEQKRSQWHVNLCAALQEYLTLSAPPHFLVPTYAATVDCWRSPTTQGLHVVAEAAPQVWRYQGLLNRIFGLGDVEWQPVYPNPEISSPAVLATYRNQFSELWVDHDLVLDISQERAPEAFASVLSETPQIHSSGPVLRLFVSSQSALTEPILKTLQEVLETSRYRPYSLKVIDVSKHPEQAEADQISATPTLVRVWPLPLRRLVGELDNPRAILGLLSDR
ncbi:circadian clock KaiB family protein [Leptolyngbya sp. PCC 6406]|uniref:circadian clock KaiB family protein n=1 Tax=Leptolyngbya sp. PCC 6406 TaxID=1173264 RepID=UPI0002AC1845|nr:circadian clock KaiB family protein [Leptolyngbya sp. PCC 6406]